MNNEPCIHCIYFKPSMFKPYIGQCLRQGITVVSKTEVPCTNFKEVSIEELKNMLRRGEWLYCMNCNVMITDEDELEKHVGKHLVTSIPETDEFIQEEALPGD